MKQNRQSLRHRRIPSKTAPSKRRRPSPRPSRAQGCSSNSNSPGSPAMGDALEVGLGPVGLPAPSRPCRAARTPLTWVTTHAGLEPLARMRALPGRNLLDARAAPAVAAALRERSTREARRGPPCRGVPGSRPVHRSPPRRRRTASAAARPQRPPTWSGGRRGPGRDPHAAHAPRTTTRRARRASRCGTCARQPRGAHLGEPARVARVLAAHDHHGVGAAGELAGSLLALHRGGADGVHDAQLADARRPRAATTAPSSPCGLGRLHDDAHPLAHGHAGGLLGRPHHDGVGAGAGEDALDLGMARPRPRPRPGSPAPGRARPPPRGPS